MNKIVIFLVFFLFTGVLFSQLFDAKNDEKIGKSIIRLIRKDTLQTVFNIFDNNDFVGELPSDGQISWSRKPGIMNLDLEKNRNIPNIQLNILENHIYMIELHDFLYKTNLSIIKKNIVNNKTNAYFKNYYLLTFPFFILILVFILNKKIRIKKLCKIGKIALEKEDYDKAIKIFLILTRKDKKNPEFWQLLEKSYFYNGEIEKADDCKLYLSNIRQNIPSKISEKQDILDMKSIKQLLQKEFPDIEKVNFVRRLKQGLSGANIFLLEIISNKNSEITFAVMKQPKQKNSGNDRNELLREFFGYQSFKKAWKDSGKNHLANKLSLLSSKNTSTNADFLFSTFADEKSTKPVRTLSEGLSKDFWLHLKILQKIGNFYKEQFEQLTPKHKIFATAFDHIKFNLETKWQEISAFDWQNFEIDTSKKFINIKGKLFPNLICFMKNPAKNWYQEGFSINHFILHGDLNPENIIINSRDDFVLIDLEKTGQRTFFYDLSFLIAWILQKFILERENNKSDDFLENIVQILISSKEITSSPEFTNFQLFIDNLFPYRHSLEQNEKKKPAL